MSDDLYLAYHEETKDAAQQRIWTFYEAIKYNNQSLDPDFNGCPYSSTITSLFQQPHPRAADSLLPRIPLFQGIE
jgi:hypothetical protein